MSERLFRRIGITGGIGCGKSATGAALQSLGVPVLDTDAVAHELLASDTGARAAIRARFGDEVFAGDEVNRKALGQVVFADPAARKDLEAILHPRIQVRTAAWLAEQTKTGPAAVLIPLLYEVGQEKAFDLCVCVACSPETQRARLRERGWSDAEIDRRNAAQLPAEEKIKRAEVVIWTEGAMESHVAQWRRVLSIS
jgi:dephospho-CoA kinase